jgi:hypothetical protein
VTGPDGEVGINYGDEHLRQELVELGVHKTDWEALPQVLQVRLKEAVRGLQVLATACQAVTECDLRDRQRRAGALLSAFNGWFRDQKKRKASFASPELRVEQGSHALDAYEALVTLLKAVKAEGRGSRLGFRSERWVKQATNRINAQLSHGATLVLPARCTSEDVARLEVERPAQLAGELLRRCAPEIVADELLRRGPKKRVRKSMGT